MVNGVAAVNEPVNAATVELSGDALLHAALRSNFASQALHYAMDSIAAYSLAAEAMTGQPSALQELLYGKLRAARAIESSTRQHLLEKGTEAALVQYVLTHQEGTGTTLSELVDLQQPPDREYYVATIATLSLAVQETVQDIDSYAKRAQSSGGYLSMDDYKSYFGLLRQTNNHLNVIIPLYAQLAVEEPTAAAKVKEFLGTKGTRIEELVQLQVQVSEMLMRT